MNIKTLFFTQNTETIDGFTKCNKPALDVYRWFQNKFGFKDDDDVHLTFNWLRDNVAMSESNKNNVLLQLTDTCYLNAWKDSGDTIIVCFHGIERLFSMKNITRGRLRSIYKTFTGTQLAEL